MVAIADDYKFEESNWASGGIDGGVHCSFVSLLWHAIDNLMIVFLDCRVRANVPFIQRRLHGDVADRA
jgi:hypothetical protein